MIRKLGRKLALGIRSFRPRRRFGVAAILGVSLLGFGGCSGDPRTAAGPLYSVKGKVLLPDGKPLTSGQVTFVGSKSGITSTASVGSDGSFTFKGGSGSGALPEGEYHVRLEEAGSAGKGSRKGPQGKLPFDSKFADEDTSGLTATVTADESKNSFEFKLDRGTTAKNSADARGGR